MLSRSSKLFKTGLKGSTSSHSRRFLSKLAVSEEIKQAIAENKPVVALESTIISHGLPFPANIEMARSVESLIRANNAVPATIAFINGTPKVGLSEEDLAIIADQNAKKYKVSRRDIPYIMANGLTGGTTIAATMILAHKAQIDVFATGGLGGVSRPFELMDVSADLDELSKTPVAVVCSGPKSILDVKRTMEYLETKGVPVSTFIDEHGNPKSDKVNIPGFYTRNSGVSSPFSFSDYKSAAKMIYSGKDLMGLENGYVFCIPPPIDVALPESVINTIISETQLEAESLGVTGKDLTPFMLGRINKRTNGVSVKCNVDFVKNNAITGAKIANELCLLKQSPSSFQPTITPEPTTSAPKSTPKPKTELPQTVNSAVVGSIALDSTSIIISDKPQLGDSNPSKTHQSPGGVGFNVALACNSATTDSSTLFVSAVNSTDIAGQSLLQAIKDNGMTTEGLCKFTTPGINTAQYTSIHDSQGGLIVACADMSIVEQIPVEHVVDTLKQFKPNFVLIDSNVSGDVLGAVLTASNGGTEFRVVYEPTSIVKASRLADVKHIECYPYNAIELITPTVAELQTIYESFDKAGKFEVNDVWFEILDMFGIDSTLRNKMEAASRKHPLLAKYLNVGLLSQSFMLLPFTPNILIKDGANGVLMVQITRTASNDKGLVSPTNFNFVNRQSAADFTIVHEGRQDFGVIIQHFPSLEISTCDIKSVTGAGDSLVGYLLSQISKSKQNVIGDLLSLEREDIIVKAMNAARLSLLSESAVDTVGIKSMASL